MEIKDIKVIEKPKDRWENGTPHDPRSEALYDFLSRYDYIHNNDCLEFNSGGDGDNGEELMYLLDYYYANLDDQNESLS